MSRLGVGTKLAYGLGQVAEQIKSRGFDIFVFFYFNQILGLEGWMTGLAVAIALVFDAVTDPLAGSLSDGSKSPRGRRFGDGWVAQVSRLPPKRGATQSSNARWDPPGFSNRSEERLDTPIPVWRYRMPNQPVRATARSP